MPLEIEIDEDGPIAGLSMDGITSIELYGDATSSGFANLTFIYERDGRYYSGSEEEHEEPEIIIDRLISYYFGESPAFPVPQFVEDTLRDLMKNNGSFYVFKMDDETIQPAIYKNNLAKTLAAYSDRQVAALMLFHVSGSPTVCLRDIFPDEDFPQYEVSEREYGLNCELNPNVIKKIVSDSTQANALATEYEDLFDPEDKVHSWIAKLFPGSVNARFAGFVRAPFTSMDQLKNFLSGVRKIINDVVAEKLVKDSLEALELLFESIKYEDLTFKQCDEDERAFERCHEILRELGTTRELTQTEIKALTYMVIEAMGIVENEMDAKLDTAKWAVAFAASNATSMNRFNDDESFRKILAGSLGKAVEQLYDSMDYIKDDKNKWVLDPKRENPVLVVLQRTLHNIVPDLFLDPKLCDFSRTQGRGRGD